MKLNKKITERFLAVAKKIESGKIDQAQLDGHIRIMYQDITGKKVPLRGKRLIDGAGVKAWLQDVSDEQKRFVHDVARKGRAKRKDVEGEAEFRKTILAIGGGNDGFTHQMKKRLDALDADFFETVIRAIKVVKSARLTSKVEGIGYKQMHLEVFSNHVFHVIRVSSMMRKRKMPLPDSYTMREIIISWVGDSAYQDLKDWRGVWKAAGIRVKQPNTGRAKAKADKSYADFCNGGAFPKVL